MNLYGKISKYFITNKNLSFLLLVGIILWGGISFKIMPKQYNPDIIAPAFLVSVDFPNATVDEVYHLVTKPLEDVLNEIPGIENIYSKSMHGGKSEVIVEFFVGENLEESMITLRQKISSRLNLSPLGAQEPYIASIDPEDLPIKTIALYSDEYDPIRLRKIANQLKEELKLVDGTSIVEVIGGRKREIQIILDPNKMQETQTSLNEIEDVLANTSLLKDFGYLKTEDKYFIIETQEQATTVEKIKNIVITSNFEKNLKIKDVADVREGSEERSNYVNHFMRKSNKYIKDVVFLSVSKQKGRNIIDVSKKIDDQLRELQKTKPYLRKIHYEIVKDEGRVAKEEISRLIKNLIQAITIVLLVLLAFLNYRAALIVAFSIPITLLTVLALGHLFGYTINRITLFALILSLGLLVDSATVVIENIVRNKNNAPNESKQSIIPQSVSEVGAGLFLSTLTTVLAFIPMLFVTGMMGPYMGPIPFFVSFALIISLIFAYTINPWLAYVFCTDTVHSNIEKKCSVICQISTHLVEKYKVFLSSLLIKRKKRVSFLIICVLVLAVVLLFPVFKLLRFRMLPKADREQIFVYIDLDRGASIERSNKLAMDAIDILRNEENIKSIQSFVGIPPVLDFNGLFKGVAQRKGTNQITLKCNLIHPKKRKLASEDIAIIIRKMLNKNFKKYPDAKVVIVEDPPGPPVRSTFYVKVKSENPRWLYPISQYVEKEVKKIREVKDVDVSNLEDNKKFVLFIDKEAAARAKVSVESISQQLQTIFSGRIIGVYHSDYNLEQEYVVLRLSRNLRDEIKDLEGINISNAIGNHVPLSRFIKVNTENEEDVILNDNRERVIYISGEMGKRSVTYAAIDLLKIMHGYQNKDVKLINFSLLKAEYLINGTDNVTIEIGGEWDLTIKVFRDLGLAMLVAIILIYLVLVAQFKSFSVPLLILGTIPLALIGVIPGFALLFILGRIYFSATSMIGVIALAGIVVNNAIIFMEYVKQVAFKFEKLNDTLMDAGLTRMRPILLTSVTTILGSLVIAVDPVWSGLAWSIVFGLSLSSLLTLVVFPSLIAEFLGDKWFNDIKRTDNQ